MSWSYCAEEEEGSDGMEKGRRENGGDGGDDSRPLREKEKKFGRTVLETRKSFCKARREGGVGCMNCVCVCIGTIRTLFFFFFFFFPLVQILTVNV